MADLSNLLGDVYGDPDGPPVPKEPAAAERATGTPLDDDLAAALSAALAAAPAAPVTPAAPPPPPSPPAPPVPPVPPVPAPRTDSAPGVVTSPAAIHDVRSLEDTGRDATEHPADILDPSAVGSRGYELAYQWDDKPLAVGDDPFVEADPAVARPWQRSDDDILPAKPRRSGLRLRR